jgi:type VI protein secretion system component Hcp
MMEIMSVLRRANRNTSAIRRVASVFLAGVALIVFQGSIEQNAFGHSLTITATASCSNGAAVISYSVISWDQIDTAGSNPTITVSFNGSVVDTEPFSLSTMPPNQFSGTKPSTATGSVTVGAIAVGTWDDGYPSGETSSVGVTVPANCAPAFPSAAVVACFGSGTITTNPKAGCPMGITPTPINALSMGAMEAVRFLKAKGNGGGGVRATHPSLTSVSLLQKQGAASDSLLQDLYAGKSVGPVVIALYEGFSTTPSFTILLTGAYVNSWQVSGAEGEGDLVESISLLFTTISILDVATNQTVSWDVVTNTP